LVQFGELGIQMLCLDQLKQIAEKIQAEIRSRLGILKFRLGANKYYLADAGSYKVIFDYFRQCEEILRLKALECE